jgi:hypothetical protein
MITNMMIFIIKGNEISYNSNSSIIDAIWWGVGKGDFNLVYTVTF